MNNETEPLRERVLHKRFERTPTGYLRISNGRGNVVSRGFNPKRRVDQLRFENLIGIEDQTLQRGVGDCESTSPRIANCGVWATSAILADRSNLKTRGGFRSETL